MAQHICLFPPVLGEPLAIPASFGYNIKETKSISKGDSMERIGIQKKNGGVVEALQQAILSGQIPAGTEMTQNELAESLGVSRMPVRENSGTRSLPF